MDTNIEAPLRKILAKKSVYGWHYYSDCIEIPPDTDDLGQLLQLVTHLPRTEYAPLMDSALLNLINNLEETGRCPTWLCDAQHYPRETISKTWFGDSCIAVMANLYYGLACYDATYYAPQIERGIHYILKQYNRSLMGWQSKHYKSVLYTHYLIARLLQKQKIIFDLDDALNKILAQQKLDGSWDQSPQETAFALLFLQTQTRSKAIEWALQKGQIFIIETQNHEGSWEGEDLFIRPGRDAHFEYFKHPKLTSAFCLRALALK